MHERKHVKLILVSLYSSGELARYLLSSYILKAYLEKHLECKENLSIEVLNFSNEEDVYEICSQIHKANPDYIGYSCYVWNIEAILKVIENLKDSGYITILGGPEISLERISRLEGGPGDYYIIGEGEKKLTKLFSCLLNGAEKIEVPAGVAYWHNTRNEMVFKEDASMITDLDEIPSVYLSGALDEQLYSLQQAFLETQRGCRYRCKYCVYHKDLHDVFYYSLPRVYKELSYLIEEKRIFTLRIFDAVFTSDISRAKKIVEYLVNIKNREGVQFPRIYWEFYYHNVDEEFIELTASLKRQDMIHNSSRISPTDAPQFYSDMLNGYNVINCVGIQSFSDQALKAVGRPKVNREKLENFMELARKHNIALKIDIILGLPFETYESYFEGLEYFLPFFEDTDHVLNIHRLQILPGSDLEKVSDEYGIDFSQEAPHLVFETAELSRKEMNDISRLTAVLFRIINSPLRKELFAARKQTGQSFEAISRNICNEIVSDVCFENTCIVKDESVEDSYWNSAIYKDIPSKWILNCLSKLDEYKLPV